MVSRMENTSSVPRRVLDRTVHGIWRQKTSLLLYSGVVAAMVGYLSLAAPNSPPTHAQTVPAAPDCADAVVAAVVGQSTSPVQQAYQCMGPDLQQRVFQDGIANQYRTIASAGVSMVTRVGTHDSENGAKLVYYAVDAGGQSVSFVVQLSPDGKVTDIS
jgi:hypothetical protein